MKCEVCGKEGDLVKIYGYIPSEIYFKGADILEDKALCDVHIECVKNLLTRKD
jgi:hypothetical protein